MELLELFDPVALGDVLAMWFGTSSGDERMLEAQELRVLLVRDISSGCRKLLVPSRAHVRCQTPAQPEHETKDVSCTLYPL